MPQTTQKNKTNCPAWWHVYQRTSPAEAETPDLSYTGTTTLASSTTYYWRIKFWDVAGTEGAWSTSTSTFIVFKPRYSQTFVYNKIGNIATSSASGEYFYASTNYANPHAPTQIGGITLTYDNNGNVTAYGTSSYTWDYRNRMTQSGNGTATSTYGYDYMGSRVLQTAGGLTTKYANKLYSMNGATTTKYIYAGDVLIATVEKVGTATTTFIIHPDHLGGTNVVTNATGTAVQTIEYYPYGAIYANTKTTSLDEAKKYTGHEYDTASGLNYMMARYQDPGRGQFLSEDPSFLAMVAGSPDLLDPQNLNAYAYVRNNPLVYRDPDGKALEFATSGTYMGLSGSTGLRISTQGINFFASGGAGAGFSISPFSISYSPGDISHKMESSIVVGGSLVPVVGGGRARTENSQGISTQNSFILTPGFSADVYARKEISIPLFGGELPAGLTLTSASRFSTPNYASSNQIITSPNYAGRNTVTPTGLQAFPPTATGGNPFSSGQQSTREQQLSTIKAQLDGIQQQINVIRTQRMQR